MSNLSKELIYTNQSVKKSTIWLLFFFFGWSYGSMNQMGKQIAYYLTFGGLGIWTLIRLFTLSSAINEYNNSIADRVGLSNEEKVMLGLKSSSTKTKQDLEEMKEAAKSNRAIEKLTAASVVIVLMFVAYSAY